MKPGDLVRVIPDENDEPDRYDGLVGLILAEVGRQMDEPLSVSWSTGMLAGSCRKATSR